PAATWQGPGGRRLDFDAQGRLQTIGTLGRPDIVVERHTGGPLDGLMRTIRRGDHALRLGYDASGPNPACTRWTPPWASSATSMPVPKKPRRLRRHRPLTLFPPGMHPVRPRSCCAPCSARTACAAAITTSPNGRPGTPPP